MTKVTLFGYIDVRDGRLEVTRDPEEGLITLRISDLVNHQNAILSVSGRDLTTVLQAVMPDAHIVYVGQSSPEITTAALPARAESILDQVRPKGPRTGIDP